MVDCHVHGLRSFDSDADYKDIFQRVLESNLNGVNITEHLDFYPGKENKIEFDYLSYSNEVDEINKHFSEKYNTEKKIYKGIELGLVDFDIDILNKFINENFFDCVIGSVHFVYDEDPYYDSYTLNKDKHQAYSLYLERYIELLPLYKGINIIGHFDYVSRYTEHYSDRNMYYKDFSEYFDAIFKYIIHNGISLEINTSSYQKRGDFPANTLDRNILKRYKELGGELISLGSDAHSPTNVGLSFEAFANIIKDCGFDFLTYFKDRKPILEKI